MWEKSEVFAGFQEVSLGIPWAYVGSLRASQGCGLGLGPNDQAKPGKCHRPFGFAGQLVGFMELTQRVFHLFGVVS